MNKNELKYIKENYYNETNVLSSLLETINRVVESEKTVKINQLIREQLEGSSLTLESIPEISVTELGWTDVRTVGMLADTIRDFENRTTAATTYAGDDLISNNITWSQIHTEQS